MQANISFSTQFFGNCGTQLISSLPFSTTKTNTATQATLLWPSNTTNLTQLLTFNTAYHRQTVNTDTHRQTFNTVSRRQASQRPNLLCSSRTEPHLCLLCSQNHMGAAHSPACGLPPLALTPTKDSSTLFRPEPLNALLAAVATHSLRPYFTFSLTS